MERRSRRWLYLLLMVTVASADFCGKSYRTDRRIRNLRGVRTFSEVLTQCRNTMSTKPGERPRPGAIRGMLSTLDPFGLHDS